MMSEEVSKVINKKAKEIETVESGVMYTYRDPATGQTTTKTAFELVKLLAKEIQELTK